MAKLGQRRTLMMKLNNLSSMFVPRFIKSHLLLIKISEPSYKWRIIKPFCMEILVPTSCSRRVFDVPTRYHVVEREKRETKKLFIAQRVM